jgi:small-conductance mechanosensitive channel
MLDRYADVFRLDALPLWQPELWDTLAAETSLGWSEPILERFREASDYAFARRQVIAFQILLVLLFAVGLRIVSAHVRARTGDEPDVEHASRVFELPISMALVVVLSATRLLHPLAPSMFLQLLWLIAVVPTVLIVRRFGAGAAVRPPLIALTLFTVVDVARAAIETLPTLGRLLLVGELFCAIVVVLVSRRRRRASVREGGPDAVHHFVDVSERAGVLLLCLAIGANLLGAAELGRIVGQGTLRCAYLGLFAYAFYRVLWSVSVFALRLRPLRLLRLVSRDREGVQRRIDPLLRFAAGCLWLLAGVRVFDLSSLAYDELASILGKELRIGALEISLGGVLGFFLTVWLSFRLSRFVSAVLEVEVFPHVRLARGVPYALSALVRYAVLFTGFMVALAVGGVELTKLTVIAGGLGVGIGFGLQNVVNNFVSGLILLFERPLQVGDSVQLPDQKIGGSILRIGTRASIIRTGDGAEVIVPNGALISSAVINWTLSDRHRRVDIDVSVERAAEAQAVIDLLEGQARSHPKVLSTPAARAYLTKLRDDALDLQLRVWIDDLDDELAVRSELGVEIQRALRAAGIGIPPGKLPLSVAQAMLRLSGGSPAHRLDLEDHVDDPGRADRQALRSVDQRKATRLRSKDLDEQV